MGFGNNCDEYILIYKERIDLVMNNQAYCNNGDNIYIINLY